MHYSGKVLISNLAREANILIYQKLIKYDYVGGYSKENGVMKYFLFSTDNQYHIDIKSIKIGPEFNLSYRLHSMIPDIIAIVNHHGEFVGNYSINQVHYNQTLLKQHGFNAILRGAMNTPAAQISGGYPFSLRNSQFDLFQIDLIRSRERKLSTFNSICKAWNLTLYTHWSNFTSNIHIQKNLENLYKSVDNVEFFVGVMVSQPKSGRSFSDGIHLLTSNSTGIG